jgi:serine/threonine protein kinase
MTIILEQAFDCLPSALAYMHQHKIRHRDIKPRNVLIHGDDVLLTDFGLAFDSNDCSHSTTTGLASPHTKRYSAPEVLSNSPRNSKADIYSLGYVFLEMFYALRLGMAVFAAESELPINVKNLIDQLLTLEDASEHLVQDYTSSQLYGIADLILLMTLQDPGERPDADYLCCQIFPLGRTGCSTCRRQISTHQRICRIRSETRPVTDRGDAVGPVDTNIIHEENDAVPSPNSEDETLSRPRSLQFRHPK